MAFPWRALLSGGPGAPLRWSRKKATMSLLASGPGGWNSIVAKRPATRPANGERKQDERDDRGGHQEVGDGPATALRHQPGPVERELGQVPGEVEPVDQAVGDEQHADDGPGPRRPQEQLPRTPDLPTRPRPDRDDVAEQTPILLRESTDAPDPGWRCQPRRVPHGCQGAPPLDGVVGAFDDVAVPVATGVVRRWSPTFAAAACAGPARSASSAITAPRPRARAASRGCRLDGSSVQVEGLPSLVEPHGGERQCSDLGNPLRCPIGGAGCVRTATGWRRAVRCRWDGDQSGVALDDEVELAQRQGHCTTRVALHVPGLAGATTAPRTRSSRRARSPRRR